MLNSIPYHILTDILARVASASATDLCNIKLTCKDLNHAGDDALVWANFCMDAVAAIPLEPSASSFVGRCEEAQNPEALFRRGLIKFFSERHHDEGYRMLQRARGVGHEASKYVVGIISLVHPDEETRNYGMRVLGRLSLVAEQSSRKKRECRTKARKILHQLWIHTFLTPIGEPLPDCDECQQYKKGVGWSASDAEDEEVFCSEACKWNHEMHHFSKMLEGM